MPSNGRYLHEVKTKDGNIHYFDDCDAAREFFIREKAIYDLIVFKTYDDVEDGYLERT